MNGIELLDEFPECLELLKSLFPPNHFTQERFQRLNQIYKVCEAKWDNNLQQRLSGIRVMYVLIAEAAPWTPEGKINYFYNNCAGQWVQRIWRAFFPTERIPDCEEALRRLAGKGFLLIDSLPFAEKYTSVKRKTEEYKKLILACSTEYLMKKINNEAIAWAEEVRVALAFRLNGNAVIDSFPEGLFFQKGQEVILREELICTDASNYTNSARLRYVFGLDKDA